MQNQLGNYFSLQSYAHALSIYNFPVDFKNNMKRRVDSLRYILQFYNKSPHIKPPKNVILQTCVNLFHEFKQQHLKNEIIDIIYLYDRTLAETLLTEEEEIKEIKEIKNEENKIKNVYTDNESVHNSTINKSVMDIAKKLISQYKKDIPENEEDKHICLDNISEYLSTLYPIRIDLIIENIEYTKENVASFNGITLIDVFLSVWYWILNKDENIQKELFNRLIEEMQEMKNKCTTGHLSRFINVLQGFTTDDFQIKISESDRCKSIISSYLSKVLQECENEKVLEEMIQTENNNTFISFIREAVAFKLLEWEKEFSIEDIANVINTFCKTKVFTI